MTDNKNSVIAFSMDKNKCNYLVKPFILSNLNTYFSIYDRSILHTLCVEIKDILWDLDDNFAMLIFSIEDDLKDYIDGVMPYYTINWRDIVKFSFPEMKYNTDRCIERGFPEINLDKYFTVLRNGKQIPKNKNENNEYVWGEKIPTKYIESEKKYVNECMEDYLKQEEQEETKEQREWREQGWMVGDGRWRERGWSQGSIGWCNTSDRGIRPSQRLETFVFQFEYHLRDRDREEETQGEWPSQINDQMYSWSDDEIYSDDEYAVYGIG